MNVSEAAALNTLLTYLLGRRGYSFRDPPTSEEAMKAAESLAFRAHKAIGAGWLPGDVRPAWEVANPPRCPPDVEGLLPSDQK